MLKQERQQIILDLLEQRKIIKISDLTNVIDVTEMTIRRDLKELEKANLLTRIHGGAKLSEDNDVLLIELSHIEKKQMNLNEKQAIASLAANEIKEGEVIFLGAGTTLELVYDFLTVKHATILTNSIFVFNKFQFDSRFELILIGGSYRPITGAFYGSITSTMLRDIHVDKAFIGVNAIQKNSLYNANADEGIIERLVLDNASKSYILADNSKFNQKAFYHFYDLSLADVLLTDRQFSEQLLADYSPFITIKQA